MLAGCAASVPAPNEAPTNVANSDSGSANPETNDQAVSSQDSPAVRFMKDEISFLNSQSSASWSFSKSGDPLGSAIGIVFDDFGGSGGCAMWWYESEEAASLAILNFQVNFFSSFYRQWTYDFGPSIILVAESGNHPCYKDATRFLTWRITLLKKTLMSPKPNLKWTNRTLRIFTRLRGSCKLSWTSGSLPRQCRKLLFLVRSTILITLAPKTPAASLRGL